MRKGQDGKDAATLLLYVAQISRVVTLKAKILQDLTLIFNLKRLNISIKKIDVSISGLET